MNRTEGTPHDRLTRLADAMVQALEENPEHRAGDKCIVFLDDGQRGGIALHAYRDDIEAMADLMVHLQAIFKANGKQLTFVPIDQMGEG